MVDPIVTPPPPSVSVPLPLPNSVALNPPMVGTATPFERVDGQNRDLILEAIRAWARTTLVDWAGDWQRTLTEWLEAIEGWLVEWNDDVIRYVQDVLNAVINNSVTIQDPVVALLIGDEDSATRVALEALLLARETKKREPYNLRDFGAIGDGITDDTAAVQAWVDAIAQGGTLEPREGYAPAGTYKISAPITRTNGAGVNLGIVNRVIRGGGQRTTIFKASAAMARVFDFRQTQASVFEDFAIDGNNQAQICIDLSWTPGAASSRIAVTRVRTLNALDCGYFVDNLGDSIFDDCNAGPFPSSACVMHWSNQGGNSYIKNATWFPTPGDVPIIGPVRASLEASFQNLKIEGGGMMGLECLDGQISQTLELSGVQMYPMKDGPNIAGPKNTSSLRMVTLSGSSKLATHTPTQSYFGGRISHAIILDNAMLNSGATGGTPNAFGPTFSSPITGSPMSLIVRGGVVSAELGATAAFWNDAQDNIVRDYSGFQIGATKRNIRDIADVGNGTNGTGLAVGAGTRMRVFNSTSVTPNFSTPIPAKGTASVSVTMGGANSGQLIEARASSVFAPGVILLAEGQSTDTVRLTVVNLTDAPVTPGALTVRLYQIAV